MLILSLQILPNSSFAFTQLSALAASAIEVGSVPVNYLPSLFRWLFGSSSDERDETLDDRLARVSRLRVSPEKFVGYEGQTMDFTAIGLDYADRTIQGLVFSWESADSEKIAIDDNGRARLVKAGMCEITCHAGTVSATARVLVKQGRRPYQSDEEWRNDQKSLSDSSSSTIGAILPNLLDRLMPTAHAQGGGYAATDYGFDEMWSEPRNLTGNPRNRAIEPIVIGSVLPEGSNFNFAVPMIGLGGRGMGASLNLYYNSRVWSRHGNAVTFAPVAGFPFAGFSLGFGRIVTYGTAPNLKYVLVDADGTQHYLGSGTPSISAPFQTTDGTHISYDGSALHYNDGTKVDYLMVNNRLLPTQITNANGNFIKITYKNSALNNTSPLAIDYVTDTKGRNIQCNYDTSGKLISITAPGYGGTAQNPVTRTVAQFDYESRTLSYTFSGLTVENAPVGSVAVLKHIYYPGTNTGYLFSYSDYGMIYSASSRGQMSIDANGVISDGVESASEVFNYPTTGATSLTDAPAFTQRTESATGATTGVYSYSSSTDAIAQTRTFTIVQPDSSNLMLTRSTNSSSVTNGLLVQTEVTKNSVSYSKGVTAYTTDGGNNIQPQSIVSYDDAGTPAKVDFDYDQYGNVTNKREYGFQIGGNWQVRRRTHFTYKTDQVYLDAYLRSLPTLVEVFDALQNTSDADDILIAKTANTYDDYAATGGMTDRTPKPPGHDSAKYTTSYTVRGNVTGTTYWTDVAGNVTLPIRLKKYDRMGNLLQEQVSCCKQKVFSYVATDYWANPPDMTKGDPAGLHLTGTTSYDFNTDLPKYIQTPTTGKIDYYYDAALRQIQVAYPTGFSETASYNDATMTATFTKTGLGSLAVTNNGWGKVIQQTDPNDGQVNTTYDAMSRVASQTNPFAIGGTPGASTNYQYDALGRATLATLPDGNTVQTSYSGATVTITDQVNRKIKRESDGLGRLVKVTEQDVATGNLTQETTYTYSLLNNLTGVNQGGQTRSFKYDALGRMLYEKIPEQTATINDGTGTLWTKKFTYTDFNAVETRTDARGVITTYSYDGINRLTGVSYNTAWASGVAATSNLAYTYDINQNSTTNGLLLSVSKTAFWDAYQESYGYDSFKRLNSVTRTIEATNYVTSYQYNTANQVTQLTYPSGNVVNINRDTKGRLSSLTDAASAAYLSGVSYNVAGQVTGWTFGNGVAENFVYSTDRRQLISQSASKSGTTLLSLSYSYSATAGQNGLGSTAGNSGELMNISGVINSTTESVAYTCDNLGRLMTSNQTTNGISAQRRFVYDRFGNRTGVWNATSGGTQIQSISLTQSGGVPTNRITSVTNSSTTMNYSYDNNGNVTNDGVHTYTLDAENRVVNVDNGTTATYAYDHQNRRIKKVIGATTTHCVWEGGQVIAEHDGSTGVVIANYTYAGSRMINKMVGSTINYFLSDRLSNRLVLDTNGNVMARQAHLPFGEEIAGSGITDKHHFTNYERDLETSLDYAVNRYDNQSLGRFTAVDPMAASAKQGLPQSWNRYTYTANDPINAKDPLGLFLGVGENQDIPCNEGGPIILIDGIELLMPLHCTSDFVGGFSQGRKPIPERIPQLHFIEMSYRVTNFFDGDPSNQLPAHSNCKKFFQDKGIYAKFLAKARAARYVDFETDEFNKNLGNTYTWDQLGFVRAGGIDGNPTSVLEVPEYGGSAAAGAAFWLGTRYKNVIAIGAAFYALQTPNERNLTIVHEVLHLYFSGGHIEIMKGLGFGTYTDRSKASRDLDAWLLSDCTTTPKP